MHGLTVAPVKAEPAAAPPTGCGFQTLGTLPLTAAGSSAPAQETPRT